MHAITLLQRSAGAPITHPTRARCFCSRSLIQTDRPPLRQRLPSSLGSHAAHGSFYRLGNGCCAEGSERVHLSGRRTDAMLSDGCLPSMSSPGEIVRSALVSHETFGAILAPISIKPRWQRWFLLATVVLAVLVVDVWLFYSKCVLPTLFPWCLCTRRREIFRDPRRPKRTCRGSYTQCVSCLPLAGR